MQMSQFRRPRQTETTASFGAREAFVDYAHVRCATQPTDVNRIIDRVNISTVSAKVTSSSLRSLATIPDFRAEFDFPAWYIICQRRFRAN
jgi:hypothetical protein